MRRDDAEHAPLGGVAARGPAVHAAELAFADEDLDEGFPALGAARALHRAREVVAAGCAERLREHRADRHAAVHGTAPVATRTAAATAATATRLLTPPRATP